MASDRSSGGISGKGSKNVNPVYKMMGSAKSYLNNVVDQAAEATSAGEAYVKSKYVYDKLPAPMKTPERTKQLKQMKDKVRQERGQYFGALLQNRKYDN